MAYEMKDGQGSLFKNDRKTSDKGPDYKGQLKLGGVEYWVAAWIKTGANGKWMSLSVVPKEGTVVAKPRKQQDDDLPPF